MGTNRDHKLHDGRTGSAIHVHLTVKALENEIYRVLKDGTVHIHLKASGSDKSINDALIAYLAEVLKTDPRKIEIIAGQSGPDKLVTILDVDVETVNKQIIHALK